MSSSYKVLSITGHSMLEIGNVLPRAMAEIFKKIESSGDEWKDMERKRK